MSQAMAELLAGRRVTQHVPAERDPYAAGRDQTVINYRRPGEQARRQAVPGGRDAPEAGVDQQNQADRDVYAAGRDQTVINDNRRVVELTAGAVPHPAAVDLARAIAG
jgi:hypothetical protein